MPKPIQPKEQLPSDDIIITQTIAWLKNVVIGCNFCPFASRELQRGSIHYSVLHTEEVETCLAALLKECERLDEDDAIETTLLILPGVFPSFDDYLDLVEQCEDLLAEYDYEGIYQVASFHPNYRFAEAPAKDAANYTNRSLYPMLHLLREASLDQALDNYPNPENIPERNVEYARKKGLAHMKLLREACWNEHTS